MGKKSKGGGDPAASGAPSVSGGVAKPKSGSGAGEAAAKRAEGEDFDLDALFSKGKAAKAKVDAAKAAEAAAKAEKEKPKEKDRILLPGQKKKKQKRENPEFVPVNKPRRYEDGLPVYKSYDDFSDLSCGQIPPKGKEAGKCPFDCWCCF